MTYSQDLRARVLNHLEDGEHSQAETADLFGISLSTLEKWWRQYQQTGVCTARPHGGPKRKLAVCDHLIETRVAAEPDVSLAALCEYVQTEQGVTASLSMMSRTLAHLQLPRKKKVNMTANGRPRGSKPSARRLSPRKSPLGRSNSIK
jgi:transposase